MKVKRLGRPDTTAKKRELLNEFSSQLGRYDQITFDGGVLTIGATHTGDMYDVAIAHEIMKGSPVIIWGVDDQSVGKAGEIGRFIDDAKNVYWTAQPPPGNLLDRTKPGDLRFLASGKTDRRTYWIREGGATTIVTSYVKSGKRIRGLAAPEVEDSVSGQSLDDAIMADLEAHGFKPDQRYVIVNYRESGHSGIGNAPALDTGEVGFLQLMAAVHDLGLTPVPMGELDPSSARLAHQYPALSAKSGYQANLLSYWTWKSVDGYGRLAQARLLRMLADKFRVAGAVGMRSGVTDLLCYVDIPTLVIDIHPIRGTVAKGWQRTLKRFDAFEAYKVVSLREARGRETETAANWSGVFTDADSAAISRSLTLLVNGERSSKAADWPQHPALTEGVKAHAKVLYENVCERCDLIGKVLADIANPAPTPAPQLAAPTPTATTAKRKNPQEELRQEIEAQKTQGVAASQLAGYETQLREDEEEIAHLEEWLNDSFVKTNDDVEAALDSLSRARKRITNTARAVKDTAQS